MYEKLKSFLAEDTLFFAVLLVLIGVISFGLGQRSVVGGEIEPAKVSPAGVSFSKSPISDPIISLNSMSVVASRSGTKYHLPECSGVSRIKDENKVIFDSIDLAKAAGYTAAANCPGLK